MDIYVGSDHAGYNLKQAVKKHLEEKGNKVIDLGSFSPDDPVDYSDIAREVAEKIQENQDAFGIIICGTGQGSAMAANRHKKVRAALCDTVELAEMSRRHNYANVLCMGERTTDQALALQIVDKFLETEPDSDERHKRRIEKFDV
jgi:ribose 5-phosphate isomerase B